MVGAPGSTIESGLLSDRANMVRRVHGSSPSEGFRNSLVIGTMAKLAELIRRKIINCDITRVAQ